MIFDAHPSYAGSNVAPYRNHWIVDAGFFIPDSAGFDPDFHSVHLVQLYYRRSTQTLYIEFRADTAALTCYRYVFAHPMGWALGTDEEPRHLTHFATAVTGVCYLPPHKTDTLYLNPPRSFNVGNIAYGGTYAATGVSSADKGGWGYLTVGFFRDYFKQVDAFLAALPGGEVWTENTDSFVLHPATHFLVEPARILMASSVSSIGVANASPMFVPDPCVGGTPYIPTGHAQANGTLFRGDVVFREGFNCQISMRPEANAIEIAGRLGSGAGESCGLRGPYEADSYGQYDVLDYATYYDRSCRRLIHTMNGQRPDSAGRLQMKVSNGVKIVDTAVPHTIVISADPESRFICD